MDRMNIRTGHHKHAVVGEMPGYVKEQPARIFQMLYDLDCRDQAEGALPKSKIRRGVKVYLRKGCSAGRKLTGFFIDSVQHREAVRSQAIEPGTCATPYVQNRCFSRQLG